MNVYYWDDVLEDYTSGIFVVIAPSLEEARTALRKELKDYHSLYTEGDIAKEPQVFDLSETRVFLCWGGS